MLFLILIFSAMTSLPSMAGVGENICGQLYPKEMPIVEREASKEIRNIEILKYIGKVIFAPSSLVQINKMENAAVSGEESTQLKMAIINIKEVKLTKDEAKSYKLYEKEIKAIQGNLKEIGFQESIKKTHNYNECLSFITSDPLYEAKLQELQNSIEKNTALMTKVQEQSTFKEIASKIPFLIRNNWTIITGKNINEIHNIIKEKKPSSVLVVSHSSPEGKLVDAEGNIFPTSYFQSLSGILENLIIYSCYPLEVIKNYKMDKISQRLNYFYPVPDKSVSTLLGKKIPVIALKSIKRIKLETLKQDEVKSDCTFSMLNKIPDGFAVFLNGVYLGSEKEKISFDCRFLQSKNKIEIYSTIKNTFTGKLNIDQIQLNSRENIKLNEFSSRTTNRHIVTKGLFNYTGDLHETF